MNISNFYQELSRVVGGRFPLPSRYQWRRYSVAFLAVTIALKINVDNIFLGMDAAIPFGLIINELV